MARIAQADLEEALGGAYVLVQLAKATGPSDPQVATFSAAVIAKAEGECNTAVEDAFDLDDPNVNLSPTLLSKETDIAVFWAWSRGTNGEAIPGDVREAYQDALRWLDNVATGKRGLGLPTTQNAASATDTKLVNLDPYHVRMTRWNLGGFC